MALQRQIFQLERTVRGLTAKLDDLMKWVTLQGKVLVVQDNEAQALKERVETQGEGLNDMMGYLGMVPPCLELYNGVGYVKTQWVRRADEEPEVAGFIEVMEPNISEGHEAVDAPDEHMIPTNSTEQRLDSGAAASSSNPILAESTEELANALMGTWVANRHDLPARLCIGAPGEPPASSRPPTLTAAVPPTAASESALPSASALASTAMIQTGEHQASPAVDAAEGAVILVKGCPDLQGTIVAPPAAMSVTTPDLILVPPTPQTSQEAARYYAVPLVPLTSPSGVKPGMATQEMEEREEDAEAGTSAKSLEAEGEVAGVHHDLTGLRTDTGNEQE